MKIECIDMNELTDSREIMQQKAPRSIRIFILIITGLLITAIAWSLIGEIDTHISATGEIRAGGLDSTVLFLVDGTITEKHFNDGDIIEEGDVIISLDSRYYIEQKSMLEEQLDENNSEIEQYQKLIESIKQDNNLFVLSEQPSFYYQYENYALELKSSLKQIGIENEQEEVSLKQIEQDILDNKNALKNVSELLKEYQNLYDVVKRDVEYTGENETVLQSYNSYCISMEKAQAIYQQCLLSYNDLKLQGTATDSQIKQAAYSVSSAESDVMIVKSNMLTGLTEIMTQLEQQKMSYSTAIENSNIKKSTLKIDNSVTDSKEKIKNSYYISINDSIASKEQENVSLKTQINEINERIAQSEIVAAQSGTLVFHNEYNVGDVVGAGTVVATIIPETDEISVILYIPEYSIAEISQGQKVEYKFEAVSETEFGKVYGEIKNISSDSFVDEKSGQKYFKAKASIDKTILTNNKGEKKELKIGMLTEVHAITGRRTIFTWLMDKLNFI